MTDPTPDKVTAYLAEALADSRSLAQINAPSWSTMPRIRRVTGRHDRLLAAVEAVLALHAEWRIYEDINESEYLYSVCKECCAASGGGQTEDCAAGHDRAECWPCATVRAISRELPGEGSTGA